MFSFSISVMDVIYIILEYSNNTRNKCLKLIRCASCLYNVSKLVVYETAKLSGCAQHADNEEASSFAQVNS